MRNVTPISADTLPSSGIGAEFLNHLKTSVIATFVLALIVSGVYPVVVWGLSQAIFKSKADGSLIGKDGGPVSKDADAAGSSLIWQGFSAPQYFHPRPSAAGGGYDATVSGGSNLGPTSAKLMFGTTKLTALSLFASDSARPSVIPIAGRIYGVVWNVTKTTITTASDGGTSKLVYPLDPSVADPNAAVNFHGRTIHATTIAAGSLVELKLSANTPVAVAAINVVDQELDAMSSTVDADNNKITLNGTSPAVINVDPQNTMIIVNGNAGAKLADISSNMHVHAMVAMNMDYDGIADRVLHYCQDNKIEYTSSIRNSAFMDADGVDDVKLIGAFGGSAAPPTIDPATPIPADAVTASGSGLDPHISPANAALQAQRVADARSVPVDKVKAIIAESIDARGFGILGDPGVNVLRLNLALDKKCPVPVAKP